MKYSWFESDKRSADQSPFIELTDLDLADITEQLHGGPLTQRLGDRQLIFNRFQKDDIAAMMETAGLWGYVRAKGYADLRLRVFPRAPQDQRILLLAGEEALIHLRLKLADFHFRLHPSLSPARLLYIDWLETRHPRAPRRRPERLYPGQDQPGLGVYRQIRDFILELGRSLQARGAFNIPEYFHDAVLFHREFNFYAPYREGFFYALVRDLRSRGVREISRALQEGRILDEKGETVRWTPGEMIAPLDPRLREIIYDADYQRRSREEMERLRFCFSDRPAAR